MLPNASALPLSLSRRPFLRPSRRDSAHPLEARNGAEAREQCESPSSFPVDSPDFPHEPFKTLLLAPRPFTDHQTCAEPPSHTVLFSPRFSLDPTPSRTGRASARAALGGQSRLSGRFIASKPRRSSIRRPTRRSAHSAARA